MRACLHSKGRRRRRNQRLSSSAAVWTVAIRRMGASARRSSIANPARGSRRSRRASWPSPGRQAWQSPSSADCWNDRHDRSDFVCLESDPFHPNVSSSKTTDVDRAAASCPRDVVCYWREVHERAEEFFPGNPKGKPRGATARATGPWRVVSVFPSMSGLKIENRGARTSPFCSFCWRWFSTQISAIRPFSVAKYLVDGLALGDGLRIPADKRDGWNGQ
jgi:hypothetical protein